MNTLPPESSISLTSHVVCDGGSPEIDYSGDVPIARRTVSKAVSNASRLSSFFNSTQLEQDH